MIPLLRELKSFTDFTSNGQHGKFPEALTSGQSLHLPLAAWGGEKKSATPTEPLMSAPSDMLWDFGGQKDDFGKNWRLAYHRKH